MTVDHSIVICHFQNNLSGTGADAADGNANRSCVGIPGIDRLRDDGRIEMEFPPAERARMRLMAEITCKRLLAGLHPFSKELNRLAVN